MASKTRPATIHLDILGQERAVDVQVRTGNVSLRELLPMAFTIAEQITAIAVEDAERAGEKVSCRAGCGACCRQLVPISALEARALAEKVEAMPPRRKTELRRRFAAAVQKMEEVGLLAAGDAPGRHALRSTAGAGESTWEDVSRRYFAAGIACPFLEDEKCGVYSDRPAICREYNVVTPPEWCGDLSDRVKAIQRPARLSEALAAATNALAEIELPSIPLALALEWSQTHGEALAGKHDGEQMFWALVEHIRE